MKGKRFSAIIILTIIMVSGFGCGTGSDEETVKIATATPTPTASASVIPAETVSSTTIPPSTPAPTPMSIPTPTPLADKPVLTIAVFPEDGGTTSFGQGTFSQRLGSVLEIRAIPLRGYEFIGWTGEVTDATAQTTSVIMDSDKTITANFRAVGTPQPPPTNVPNVCEFDRDTIQEALDEYHELNGAWPTSNGQPGDIVWDKLIPDFMASMPVLDRQCEWQVNSNPEGQVCVMTPC